MQPQEALTMAFTPFERQRTLEALPTKYDLPSITTEYPDHSRCDEAFHRSTLSSFERTVLARRRIHSSTEQSRYRQRPWSPPSNTFLVRRRSRVASFDCARLCFRRRTGTKERPCNTRRHPDHCQYQHSLSLSRKSKRRACMHLMSQSIHVAECLSIHAEQTS